MQRPIGEKEKIAWRPPMDLVRLNSRAVQLDRGPGQLFYQGHSRMVNMNLVKTHITRFLSLDDLNGDTAFIEWPVD